MCRRDEVKLQKTIRCEISLLLSIFSKRIEEKGSNQALEGRTSRSKMKEAVVYRRRNGPIRCLRCMKQRPHQNVYVRVLLYYSNRV